MSDAPVSRVRVKIDDVFVEVDEGATIAAALAVSGAGIRGARRSVSGEARAAFCGMGVCHECRVTVDGRAHVLACQTPCRDGQVIQTSGPR
ncbi:(2Fe-2S)-binding protein [Paraburkholderia bengalensis]|uniref:(2Fe-2S)-binding protein n=1 Tax=Paraburkholderia bengalensis TaxID=2747562 RepID=A0ABU8J7C3_9BURK